MKRLKVILLTAVLAVLPCVPMLSGCGGGKVDYKLVEENGQKHYIVSCSGFTSKLTGDFEIPSYYGEGETRAPVTEIAEEGFAGTRFSSVALPETITKMGNAAFSYCYSLKSVSFADNIKLDKISHGAFAKSTALCEIALPDVKIIEGLAFSGCEKLAKITLGGELTEIGTRAFENCTSLSGVVLPAKLVTIGMRAFENCTSLESIVIPDSVKDIKKGEEIINGIGYLAFSGCSGLKTVKIGKSVTVIPAGAFGYCTSLESVYLPRSLQTIEGALYEKIKFRCGHAFHNTPALTGVYFEGSEEEYKLIKIGSDTVYENGTVYNNSTLLKATMHYNREY